MFYKAVVTDNIDPLSLDRVKVRIIGVHTLDTKILPDADLPFADQIALTDESSIPAVGSLVYIDFLDSYFQKPVYLGQTRYKLASGESSVNALYDGEALADGQKTPDDKVTLVRRNENKFVKGKVKTHIATSKEEQTGDIIITNNGSKITITKPTAFGTIKFGGLDLFDFLQRISCVGNLGLPAPLDPLLITELKTAVANSQTIEIG